MKLKIFSLLALTLFVLAGCSNGVSSVSLKSQGSDTSTEKAMMDSSVDKMAKDTSVAKVATKMESKDVMMDSSAKTTRATYIAYTKTAFDAAKDKKRVYFFHAAWCPSCKSADSDLKSNLSKIPAGVAVFKTDYDTESALKKTYGITYQHTFVQVDGVGKEVAKWNGGDVDTLLRKLQ